METNPRLASAAPAGTAPRPQAPVVALDIGNVCLHLAPDAFCARLGLAAVDELGPAHAAFLALARQLETGTLQFDAFLDAGARLLPDGIGRDALREAWFSIIGPEVAGMAAIVDGFVRAGLRIVFFSDVSAVHFAFLRPRLSFADRVHGAVLSCDVGDLKPGAAMFRAMEERHCGGGVPTLYLDDKEANIEGALARGWPAFRFETVDGLRRHLDRQPASGPGTPVR